MVLSFFLLIQWFLHTFTHNNKSALRPGAKNQIEAQLVKGLLEDHFAIASRQGQHVHYH